MLIKFLEGVAAEAAKDREAVFEIGNHQRVAPGRHQPWLGVRIVFIRYDQQGLTGTSQGVALVGAVGGPTTGEEAL